MGFEWIIFVKYCTFTTSERFDQGMIATFRTSFLMLTCMASSSRSREKPMSDVAFHQETDPLGTAEEIIGDGILVNRVNPGADEGDFLGTNVPVEIDLAIPVIH